MVGNADIVGRACVGVAGGWLERVELTLRPLRHLNTAHRTHVSSIVGTENGKDAEEEEKLIKLKAEHKNKWKFGELSHYIVVHLTSSTRRIHTRVLALV